MIKQITNLNGISIEMNKIIKNSSEVHKNEPKTNLENGDILLYKFSNISSHNIKKAANAKLLVPIFGKGFCEFSVFKNTINYDPNNVHWFNKPTYDQTICYHNEEVFIEHYSSELKFVEIDLTEIFNECLLSGNDNFSITITFKLNNSMHVLGQNHEELKKYPLFSVLFTEIDSFSPSFDYLTEEIEFGGKSFVNTLTGNLHHKFEIFKTNSKKIPITFSMAYMQRPINEETNTCLIKNWKTNFEYSLKIEDSKITIISSEGIISYYEKIDKKTAEEKYQIKGLNCDFCYINRLDNSYIVKENSETNKYILNDPSKNKIYFQNNKLVKIVNEENNFIEFFYRDDKLNKIESSDGNIVAFSYEYNKLKYVYFINEKKRIFFEYENQNTSYFSIKVNFQIEEIQSNYLGYTTNYKTLITTTFLHQYNKLHKIYNQKTKEGLLFDYIGDKVEKISNTIDSDFKKINFKKLHYTKNYTKITDFKNNSEYLTYNTYGMLQQKIDEEGNALSLKHKSVGIDGISKKVSDTSIVSFSKNKLLDNSFELVGVEGINENTLGWKTNLLNNIFQSEDSLYGQHSLCIENIEKDQIGTVVYQTINVKNGKYDLEFFAKTKNFEGYANVAVFATFKTKNINNYGTFETFKKETFYSRQINSNDKEWTKIAISDINIDSLDNTCEMKILIFGSQTKGKLFIDDIKFSGEKVNINDNMLIGGTMNNDYLTPNGFEKINCGKDDKIVTKNSLLPYSLILGEKHFRFKPTSTMEHIKSLERIIPLFGSSNENLTFAFWAMGKYNNKTLLKGKIELLNNSKVVQEEEINVDKTISNWQLLSLGIVTQRSYDSIKLSIEYSGKNEAFIDNISFFRNIFSSHYTYDEKGNLMQEINNASEKKIKVKDSKIVESNDEFGDKYSYKYDQNGRVKKVFDTKGNIIDLSYDDNGNRTKSKITSKYGTLEFKNEYGKNDLLTKSLDELGNVTKFEYDSMKRLKNKEEANGLLSTHTYDDYNNLISLVKSGIDAQISASYSYYDDGSLKKIICENGTTYEFIYDVFGRVIEIKLNDSNFVFYKYGLVKEGIQLDNITKQIIGNDVYEFFYDFKTRLEKITLNNVELVRYEYNNFSNISKKIIENKESYFSYDNKGNLIREIRNNGESFKYDYDNLDKLQKSNITIAGIKKTYDFEYLSDYNEYNKKGLIDRIDKTFSDDIVDFNISKKGIYGTKPSYHWSLITSYKNFDVCKLNKKSSKVIYDLNTVNSLRTKTKEGQDFDRNKWVSTFKNRKTIFGWFRFSGQIDKNHKIFAFGDNLKDIYYVELSKNNSNFIFDLKQNDKTLDSITLTKTNELVFIGLKLEEKQEDKILFEFTVNNLSKSKICNSSNSERICNLTKFVLGNRDIKKGSMEDNPFVEEIASFSIGAYEYDNLIFQNIRLQETKYNNYNIKPKTGVSWFDSNIYKDFEVMTLNGSFKSSEGRNPKKYEFIDSSYKSDKIKLFKYDEDLEKHVYGSFGKIQGLSNTKALLSYQHDLKNKGSISLNFKIESNILEEKTIFDFRNKEESIFKLQKNSNSKLEIVIGSIIKETNLLVENSKWNKLVMCYENNNIKLYLNDLSNMFEINLSNYNIDLFQSELFIGCTLDSNKEPIKHLDGVIEMLALSENNISSNVKKINNILKGSQLISVKTEIDEMGRSLNDIIDTGLADNLNVNKNKQIIANYSYTSPSPGKTSLQVNRIKGFDGLTRNYSYDNMGNITNIKSEELDNKYEYDSLSKLVKEYNSYLDQTICYEYGKNNNINKVKYYLGDNTLELLKEEIYNYDNLYKDKLISITTIKDNLLDTKTISYDNKHTPITFFDKQFVWQGRRLIRVNSNISYTYNETGIRTSKVVNGITTNYHLVSDKVYALTKGDKKVLFHYNERDLLVGFEYNNNQYFYNRDLTGVITSIIDINGNVVVKYNYDAWGNWINKENSGQNKLGNELVNINPFIYKGYIYDEETDFYYLKSRYYSPKIRRFINVDSEIGERNNLEYFNLFCYCINNPVNLADEDGNWPRWFKWVVVGVLVVAAVAAAAVTAGAALGAASVLVAGMSSTVLATAGSAITIAGTTIATAAVVKAGALLAMSYVSYELTRYSMNSINEIINSDYDSFGIMETSRGRQRDSGLAGVENEDLEDLLKNAKNPAEKRRYEKEQKARGLRNKKKRQNGKKSKRKSNNISLIFYPKIIIMI